MKDCITTRQTAIIASIVIFANKILALPSLLFQYARGDALLVFLTMFCLDIGVLFIFFALKNKYRNESFFEILSHKLTKSIAILIYIVLLVYFFLEVLLNFNVTGVYFKNQIYHNDEKLIFMIISISIFAIVVSGGLKGLARTFEFFYYPIILGCLICLLISFFNFNKPLILFDISFHNYFTACYKYLFSFGDILILFLIMDKIKYDDKSKKTILLYVLSTMGIILFGTFMFLSLFPNTGFLHSNSISDIILLSPEIFSIGRLDIIAVTTVMFLTLCQGCVYGYILCDLVRKLIPKMPLKLSIFIVSVIFLTLYATVFKSTDIVIGSATSWGMYIALFLQYILPIICTFFLIGKRKKEESS